MIAGMVAAAGLAACASDEGDRPWVGGGGAAGASQPGSGGSGGGTGTGSGSGSGSGTGSTTVSGRVCLIADLRATGGCTSPAGAGVAVTSLSTGATTTTDQTGSFTLQTGSVGSQVMQIGIGSQATVPTITRVDVPGTQVNVPIANANDLTQLETGLGTNLPDGMGMAALHLVNTNGAGALGYTVTPPPGTTGGPFYDDQTAVGFANGGTTGAAGTALLFGVPAGNFDIAFGNGQSQGTFTGVPIFPGALTFVTSTIGTP
jgi:hypothetical protein